MLVLVLAAVAGSLFMIFTFIATTIVSETTGLMLFVVVTGLLIVGYMLGFVFVAFVTVLILI